jgi:hypothetical protein
MANWLQKISTSVATRQMPPAQRKAAPPPAPLTSQTVKSVKPQTLPNASIIYGVASSILFVVSFCFILRGLWGTGLVILLPALGLLGYALYYLKYRDE